MRPNPPRQPILLRLTQDSRLRAILRRMISTNSLAAFTQEVSRSPPARPVRGISPTAAAPAQATGPGVQPRSQESLPPMPSRPLPRGSLLDLRV